MTLPFVLGFAIVIMILTIVLSFSSYGGGSGSSGSVPASTVKREALPSGTVVETNYYTDELDWIGNSSTLISGMRNFYKETGVQPYLYITDNINGSNNPTDAEVEAFLEELYDELFSDEAHLLVLFFEYNAVPKDWYYWGRQANTLFDDEAIQILGGYLAKYYDDTSLSEEEFFSRAFNDAGKRIMSVTVSPWIYVLIVFIVLAIIVIIFAWWSKAKKQKNLEAEQTERILNTPLETFGDADVDNLKKKYDDNKE